MMVPMSGPAEVELLVDFLNTIDVETGEEDFDDDASCAAWFQGRRLTAKGLEIEQVRDVRNALRAAADGAASPVAALAGVPLQAALDDGVPALTSSHPLGSLVATAVRLAYEGRWDRLKLCDMHTCRYAFYDESRNRSGRWCSMRVCGNRAKTRAFRERNKS
jgi:predicted RNA-binding Zn ribbon-like protein